MAVVTNNEQPTTDRVPTGWERIPNAAHYDGLILPGYHAMVGTPEAVVEHT